MPRRSRQTVDRSGETGRQGDRHIGVQRKNLLSPHINQAELVISRESAIGIKDQPINARLGEGEGTKIVIGVLIEVDILTARTVETNIHGVKIAL